LRTLAAAAHAHAYGSRTASFSERTLGLHDDDRAYGSGTASLSERTLRLPDHAHDDDHDHE
jgi:hypothetical protein